MKRLTLVLEQTADAVFPMSAATTGTPQCLPYVPGRTLLGWAAMGLYPDADMSQERSWSAFHSGAVRFGNGYPLTKTNQMAFPGPQCWFEKKRDKGGVDHAKPVAMIANDQVRNLMYSDGFKDEQDKRIQAEALKNILVACDGSVAQIKRGLRAMTAIAEGSRRAKKGALFGYEYLEAGHCFAAVIEADDDVDDDVWNKISQRFKSGRKLKLGHSKASEFGGHFSCTVLDGEIEPPWMANQAAGDLSTLTLWCLSDIALIDPLTGAPVTAPQPEHLGLKVAGELCQDKSFIATRRYSLFNAFARCHEPEQIVIAAGSVLHFTLDDKLGGDDLALLQGGVGLGREMGLGRVWVNPQCLSDEQPQFIAAENCRQYQLACPKPDRSTKVSTVEDWPNGETGDALKAWATAMLDSTSVQDRQRSTARDWATDLRRLLLALARMRLELPSKSQWANVRRACTQNRRDNQTLSVALFDRGSGVCPIEDQNGNPRNTVWTRQVMRGGRDAPLNISAWLRECLSSNSAAGSNDAGEILLLVVDEIMRERELEVSTNE